MSRSPVGNTIASTPGERQQPSSESLASASSKKALKPLIKKILPKSHPGMFPHEVSRKLMSLHSDRLGDQDMASVHDKVRIGLTEMHEVGEVERARATGPKGGRSYQWIVSNNAQMAQDLNPETPSARQQAPSRAGSCTPVTPTPAGTQLDSTLRPWRSAQDVLLATRTEETLGQQQRSRANAHDTGVVGDNAAERRPFQDLSHEHDVGTVPVESGADAEAQGQDADSPSAIVELGQKVLRIHVLKAELAESISKGTEHRAQQEGVRSSFTALERDVQENKAKVSELEAEARSLQEQLSSVKHRAAEYESRAHQLSAEAVEKKGECAQCEVAVAESDTRRTSLDRELFELRKALDID